MGGIVGLAIRISQRCDAEGSDRDPETNPYFGQRACAGTRVLLSGPQPAAHVVHVVTLSDS
jgi:hypothetical protein